MSDSDIGGSHPPHGLPFSAEEIEEFDGRFLDHELRGLDEDGAGSRAE